MMGEDNYYFCACRIPKKIASKYGFHIHIQSRINDGGCKVDEIADFQSPPGTLITKPESWNVPEIIQLFAGLCNTETSFTFQEEC